jgi:tetratricopeptide (TPR) repeat protein
MSHDKINKSDPSTGHEASRIEDLERTCFVIMPFGLKEVAGREVDFTAIYEKLFEPAINAARTPEGEALIPKRTDMEAFSGSINQDMFEYIMYSRVAFADISGFNPNVFYEIGARHATQEAGTVIFRQQGHSIPFDIATIKVFEYCDPTIPGADESRDLITRVLTDTLKRNRLDSPVRLALRSQWGGQPEPPRDSGALASPPDQSHDPLRQQAATSQATLQALQSEWRKQEVEHLLRDAEEAVRVNELETARIHYWAALRFDPTNLLARMRLGLVLKQQGRNYDALEEFTTLSKLAPDYAEAWKEKGIAEGLIARMIPAEARKKASWMPDGSRVTAARDAAEPQRLRRLGLTRGRREQGSKRPRRRLSHVHEGSGGVRRTSLPAAQRDQARSRTDGQDRLGPPRRQAQARGIDAQGAGASHASRRYAVVLLRPCRDPFVPLRS